MVVVVVVETTLTTLAWVAARLAGVRLLVVDEASLEDEVITSAPVSTAAAEVVVVEVEEEAGMEETIEPSTNSKVIASSPTSRSPPKAE